MFLPTILHTTTARHVELVDLVNLTCHKHAQITRTSLRNSKNT